MATRARMGLMAGLLFLLLMLMVSLIVMQVSWLPTASRLPRGQTALSSKPEGAEEAQSSDLYLIKENGGQVVIYRLPDVEKPIEETDIRLSALRTADQDELKKGIRVSNWEDLQTILEDFSN
jgi:hypothetical protein